MNGTIWISVFLLSLVGAFLVHQISEDPIDWSSSPTVFEKPKELLGDEK